MKVIRPKILRPKLLKGSAMEVWRVGIRAAHVVYFIIVPRPLKYPHGKSPIAYMGTSKRGLRRIAASAAERAEPVLGKHGIRSFSVRVATCERRQNLKTWEMFEEALLLRFRE